MLVLYDHVPALQMNNAYTGETDIQSTLAYPKSMEPKFFFELFVV